MTEVTGVPTRNGLVRFDRAQVLSDSQKLIAQANIGIASALAGFAVLSGGNTFTGDQMVNGDVSATGKLTASNYTQSPYYTFHSGVSTVGGLKVAGGVMCATGPNLIDPFPFSASIVAVGGGSAGNCAIQLNGAANGFYSNTTGQFRGVTNGSVHHGWATGIYEVQGAIGICTSSPGSGASDLWFNRQSANTAGIGTTTTNALGSLNLANITAGGSITAGTKVVITGTPSGGASIADIEMSGRGTILRAYGTGYGVQPLYCYANGGFFIVSETGALRIGSNTQIVRNATGPTLETRAAGGLKVCNADGSAVAAVECSQVSSPMIIAPADLTLRATSSTMLLQVSNGNFTPCRLSPGALNGPSQLGLSSTNNASVTDLFLNAVSTGVASLTSDIGKTTGADLTLGSLTSSGNVVAGSGSSYPITIGQNGSVGSYINFSISGSTAGFAMPNVDQIRPTKDGVVSDDTLILGVASHRLNTVNSVRIVSTNITASGTVTVGGTTNAVAEFRNSSNNLYAQFNGAARSFYAGGDAFAVLTSDGSTRLYNNGRIGWNTGSVASSGTVDIALGRAGVNTVGVYAGVTGSTLATLLAGQVNIASINNNIRDSGGNLQCYSGDNTLTWQGGSSTFNVYKTATFSGNLTVNGNIIAPLGSVSSTAIQPTGSTNSGLYWTTTTNLSVAVSGTERFRFGSTGLFSVTEGLAIGATVAVPDVRYIRNATGPTAEIWAASGLKICNAAGSAVAPLNAKAGGTRFVNSLQGTHGIEFHEIASDGRTAIRNSANTGSSIDLWHSGFGVLNNFTLFSGNILPAVKWGAWSGNNNNICMYQSSTSGADATVGLYAERYADVTTNGQPKLALYGKKISFNTKSADSYLLTGIVEQAYIDAYSFASKPRSSTVAPNTTDVLSGFSVWWHDTVGNGRRYAYNDSGVIYQSPLLKSSTPATPADLAEVIAVLQHWGLCA